MTRDDLQVNVERFYRDALWAGWGYAAARALWALAGKPVPTDPGAWGTLPMKTVRYGELAPRLCGRQRLAVVNAIEGLDGVKTSGVVLLAMARQIFLPQLARDHALRGAASRLLDALAGYLLDGQPAESYIVEAYRFRTDPAFDGRDGRDAFIAALPAAGLDFALASGGWNLSIRWRSFGSFMASGNRAWGVLNELAADAGEASFVDGDDAADAEARAELDALIDARRDALAEEALAEFDDFLADLVDGMLVTLCSPSARQG
ncbi:hypothetical protein [Thauera butanivorans]|uniref:hypothetical protein n=1 Tax=Thauera butanivorans TaxID=86174 RepID=UPI000838D4EC|nr:hypothetical protein [Thauera butanivorans]